MSKNPHFMLYQSKKSELHYKNVIVYKMAMVNLKKKFFPKNHITFEKSQKKLFCFCST